ncbi:hypothetical protein DMP23_21290 [Amycolatopsis sp. A1MSW2902]|uniref:hypothetical protein n=1 Tax=Amycolatopsis sp. A1MSW2902 TaxID=687413 RepID=UPI00307ED704
MPEREQGQRRRRRRSSAEIVRLKALRQAHAERLERVRADEQRVEDALGPFAAAAGAIAEAEQRQADRLAKVEAKLERELADLDSARAKAIDAAGDERRKLKDALDAETDRLRAEMGASVIAIRNAGTGMPETAELLGITVREARSLVAAANRNASHATEEKASPTAHTAAAQTAEASNEDDMSGARGEWRPGADPAQA